MKKNVLIIGAGGVAKVVAHKCAQHNDELGRIAIASRNISKCQAIIDSVNAKAALIAWCKRRKIQIITTGGAGGQIDPTLIQVCDLNRTFNDPLASKVRSTLRRDYGFSRTVTRHYSVPCVFSTEQLRYPKPDGSICLQKSFVGDGVKLDCAGGFGAVMMVTATFGMVAATKAVEKIVAGMRRPSERAKAKDAAQS